DAGARNRSVPSVSSSRMTSREDDMPASDTIGGVLQQPAARMGNGAAPHRLWGGRFATGPAPSLDELNRSLPVDARLWREDIEASRAWVQALLRAGVLTRAEAHTLDEGLARVARRIAEEGTDGAADEDIHT